VLAAVLLAWWLGVRGLGADAFWYDEDWTLRIVGAGRYGPLSLGDLMAAAVDDPWQPPLYYALLWGWGRLVGWGDVALRSLSLMIGVLVVPATARLGAAVAGQRAGLMAGVMAASSAFIVYYLHELRPYSLFVTASALFLWRYWQLVRATRQTPRQVGAYVLVVALLAYSHYFSALLFLGVGVYHLLFERKSGRFWWVGLWTLAGIGLFLPWLSVPLGAIGEDVTTGQRTNMPNPMLLGTLFYGLSNGWLGLLAAIAAALLAAWRGWRELAFGLVTGGVLLGLAVGMNAYLPLVAHSRYLAPLWVVFVLLAAVSVARLPGARLIAPLFLAVWVGLGVWHSTNTVYFDRLFTERGIQFFSPHLRWDVVAEVLDERANENEAVIFSTGVHPWAVAGAYQYYLHGSEARYVLASQLETPLRDEIRFFIGEAPRVWVGTEDAPGAVEAHAQIEALVAQDYEQCGTAYDDGQLSLAWYARETVCCGPPQTSLATFGEVALGAGVAARADDALKVTLAWQVGADVPVQQYSVTTYLMSAANEVVAQMDYPLPDDPFICVPSELAVGELAEGRYTLYTTVYAWETGERLAEAVPVTEIVLE